MNRNRLALLLTGVSLCCWFLGWYIAGVVFATWGVVEAAHDLLARWL